MVRKGSMTIFFALVLSMIIVLVCTSIGSVEMMCARTQIANSADVGMYSLFAQYDPYLLEQYDLFYVDASYGTGDLRMDRVYRTVEDYMEPILDQGYLDLSIASGGITSFTLATDHNGQPFWDQVVDHMEETFGSQGIQFLVDRVLGDSERVKEQQEMKEQVEERDIMADYDGEIARAGNESAQAGAELPGEEPGPPVEDPIKIIREIQEMGILELVIPDPASLSDREIDPAGLASHRALEAGMGALVPASDKDPSMEDVLFQEYMMQNCGTYARPSEGSGLRYQVEYIIGREGSDRENLKKIAERLLLIREGVNLAFLYTDPEKRAQSASLAAAIASGFLVPPAAGVIEMALLLCWSFGESVLDVRALFGGGRVPLVKGPGDWRLSLEELPGLLAKCSGEEPQRETKGLDYTDHLRMLLSLESKDSKVMGSIDMIEADIRAQPGRSGFCMDHCLGAMEVAVDVEVDQNKVYTVSHRYGFGL